MKNSTATKSAPELAISPEKLCFIIVKAHEFDAKDIVTDPRLGLQCGGRCNAVCA